MAAQEAKFDDEATDLDEKYVGQNDLTKLRDAHFNAGVREGIAAGTQCTLQDGFNCGYKEAFFHSHNFGKVRGVLSAVLFHVSLENKEQNCNYREKYKDRIDKLTSELERIEEHHSKITYDTASSSMTRLKNEPVGKIRYNCSTDGTINEPLTRNDSSNMGFKELLILCRQLCDELGLDPDIVGIPS